MNGFIKSIHTVHTYMILSMYGEYVMLWACFTFECCNNVGALHNEFMAYKA